MRPNHNHLLFCGCVSLLVGAFLGENGWLVAEECTCGTAETPECEWVWYPPPACDVGPCNDDFLDFSCGGNQYEYYFVDVTRQKPANSSEADAVDYACLGTAAAGNELSDNGVGQLLLKNPCYFCKGAARISASPKFYACAKSDVEYDYADAEALGAMEVHVSANTFTGLLASAAGGASAGDSAESSVTLTLGIPGASVEVGLYHGGNNTYKKKVVSGSGTQNVPASVTSIDLLFHGIAGVYAAASGGEAYALLPDEGHWNIRFLSLRCDGGCGYEDTTQTWDLAASTLCPTQLPELE